MRIAEQASRRMTPERFRAFPARARIAALAARKQAFLTEEAFAAGNGKGYHNPIADFKVANLGTKLDDLTHRFVAHYIAALHARHEAVIEVEVGTADSAGGHLDDGIARMLDLRVCDRITAYVTFTVPTERLHYSAPFKRDTRSMPAAAPAMIKAPL